MVQESQFDQKKRVNLGISKNRGTPKSSILIGFSTIDHPFSGPYFWKQPFPSCPKGPGPQKSFFWLLQGEVNVNHFVAAVPSRRIHKILLFFTRFQC